MTKAQGSDVPTHLLVRHARIRETLITNRIEAILLTCPADVGYVTGVSWDDCNLLLDHDHLLILTDSRYDEEVALRCPWIRRRVIRGKETMVDIVSDTLIKSNCRKVGVEQNFITLGLARAVEKKIKETKSKGPRPRLVAVNNLMVNVRKTKDTTEIAVIRKAIACAQDAYSIVRRDVRIGATENEIAGRMEFEMRRLGAQKSSFDTNVSAAANSSKPHYRPADAAVASDAALLFDWGAVIEGYCSDITRTHFVGRAPQKLREVYKIVLEAQLAAIDAIRPGVATRKVDKAARDVIAAAGYGKNFGHGLGHGIGLAIHELPRLSRVAAPEPLVPGMVVTVEPGIYLPGVGGVRIEDDVLVTENGCEVMTSLDKSFEGCHLE